jgi:hypothetical protein
LRGVGDNGRGLGWLVSCWALEGERDGAFAKDQVHLRQFALFLKHEHRLVHPEALHKTSQET